MGDTSDSSNAIFNALRDKEKADAKAVSAAETIADEVTSGQDKTSTAAERVSASNSAILVANIDNGKKIDTLNGKIDQLIGINKTKSQAKTSITIPLTIDGRVIASVVATHADDPEAASTGAIKKKILTENALAAPG